MGTAEAPDATFDGLSESDGYDSLDAKLAAALSKIPHGELGRRVTHKVEVCAAAGKMIKGRQILFMIYEQFRLSEVAGSLYEIGDLMSVRLKGDALEHFLITWDSVVSGMKKMPEDLSLIHISEPTRPY